MTRVRALALVEEERRNAAVLERIEADPPRYLNAIYLIGDVLPERLGDHRRDHRRAPFGGWGITIVSVVFTVLYFVVVEAMSEDVRRPAQRPRGAGGGAARLVPRPSARPADARADRPRELAPARDGA